jgi:hypothetical protein
MGGFRLGRKRLVRVLALSAMVVGALAALAPAAGPGGWDHLGDRGAQGTDSLDLVASALAVTPGVLYVGGEFTDAGGKLDADRIATWNGSSWNGVSSPASFIPNGRVSAIAVAAGKVYAGGSFTNAGGNASADFLAVWNGRFWEPFCEKTGPTPGPSFDGNVTSLQIVDDTLYVGGEFQNGAGIEDADYLLACALADGASSPTVTPGHPFDGPVYALTADGGGTLYAGGGFIDLEGDDDADKVAYLPPGGTWQPMGADGAVTDFVRGLTAVGTDVYIGTDANDIAGIARADHVAKWDGTAWSALGSDTAGTNGWFSTNTSINALAGSGSNLFVTGTFLDANGEARADHVAFFDGTDWHPVGSDGAGNGPWSGNGLALALVDRLLYAAGSFTSAGGDGQAHSVASFSLTQIIAFPTPTPTASPAAQPTPTVTPGPAPQPTPTVTPTPDDTAPDTTLPKARINQTERKATFNFASAEPGSGFLCKLDRKKFKPCTSPKTYKRLTPGKHVFRVKARDAAGNVDATPKVKRFKIRKR